MSEKTIGEFADRFLEHTRDVGVTMPKEVGIAKRRRKRQRMAGRESPFGDDNPMALFEHNGVLQWEDLIEAARPSGRGRGAESSASADGHLVLVSVSIPWCEKRMTRRSSWPVRTAAPSGRW